ncbi:MAG: patatin-like phospholipase family protein [Bacillota bacterium]|nr:patatin-like phospholipase family protein [Bacillota bacterium]
MKIGLALSGGGGKGSYQIGVWRALREFGLEPYICCVSGTSIGALNAVLFAQGNLELAETIWKSIREDQIFSLNLNWKKTHAITKLPNNYLKWVVSFLDRIAEHGWFSHAGLQKIIKENINLSAVSSSPIDLYATCFNISRWETEYFQLNTHTPKEIEQILLASSALPLIFDQIIIKGNDYCDGGIGDNLPIQPVYESGADIIIAVHLSRDSVINNKEAYQNTKLIEIVPMENQGGLFSGTLDFSIEGVKRRMEQGYHDTKQTLQPFYQFMKTQHEFIQQVQLFQEQAFLDERKTLVEEKELLKEELQQYIHKGR